MYAVRILNYYKFDTSATNESTVAFLPYLIEFNRSFERSGDMGYSTGINYAETQVTQWDCQIKGIRISPARLSFVSEVPLCNLFPASRGSFPGVR